MQGSGITITAGSNAPTVTGNARFCLSVATFSNSGGGGQTLTSTYTSRSQPGANGWSYIAVAKQVASTTYTLLSQPDNNPSVATGVAGRFDYTFSLGSTAVMSTSVNLGGGNRPYSLTSFSAGDTSKFYVCGCVYRACSAVCAPFEHPYCVRCVLLLVCALSYKACVLMWGHATLAQVWGGTLTSGVTSRVVAGYMNGAGTGGTYSASASAVNGNLTGGSRPFVVGPFAVSHVCMGPGCGVTSLLFLRLCTHVCRDLCSRS